PAPALAAPPRPQWVTRRRPVEALLGGVLAAGGATALTIGLVAVAQDGGQVVELDNGREEVYTATARDTVLIAAGAAAVVGGVFLLIDGLRARRSPVAITVSGRPYADGAWVGLGGRL
ncbi:MAG: hypothetical protein Q8S73_21120, partial [Deltaproteobacteria bacterium]|nr:hypothetical protein [Deltaproteobacteria bacterium]